MRDFIEQVNFLKIDDEVLLQAENNLEDFCYYTEPTETV